MTFDQDFCYFILFFSSLLKKEGGENENEVAKIVIKSHTFLFHPLFLYQFYYPFPFSISLYEEDGENGQLYCCIKSGRYKKKCYNLALYVTIIIRKMGFNFIINDYFKKTFTMQWKILENDK